MVICIAIFLFSLIFLTKAFEVKDEWEYSKVDGIIKGALVVLLALLATAIPITISTAVIGSDVNRCTMTVAESKKIIALKDNPSMSGSYFLFSGYVDEKLYYYYAEETELGYRTDKVRASDCYIVYSETEPRIDRIEATGFKKWYTWIYAIPSAHYYTIYVPDGTVATDYEIDLE